jgi:hypothetical protein
MKRDHQDFLLPSSFDLFGMGSVAKSVKINPKRRKAKRTASAWV